MTSPDRLAAALADRYRLERELGQGGMATVHLAQDLRHDRRVAVKVLRSELAAVIGAERFLAEIRTTANLQHPHILPLFDSGSADGFLYYVMPFVEGETLRDRLVRERQLPVADAVRIASEVAGALDYAHRHGVIHRDIKPENILLHDGRAMVADFGIARAASNAGSARMTETGMSLGTPHYMSPEQAMGERDLDARSDVYALGAMTYELLTGEPPFTGPTAQAIVAKVLTASPEPVTTLRKTVPPAVVHAVHRAIEKLPADRFASAAEFAAALASTSPPTVALPAASARAARRGPLVPLLGAATLGFGLLAVWALARRPGTSAPAVYDMALPDSAPMAIGAALAQSSYGSPGRSLSVAPDGSFVVYVAQRGDSTELWWRSLRDASARELPGTVGGAAPELAPDGAHVVYRDPGSILVTAVAGGEPRRMMEQFATTGFSWLTPTTLVASDLDGYRHTWLDIDGGTIRRTVGERCIFGHWIPGERALMCTMSPNAVVVAPDSGTRVVVRTLRTDGSPGVPLVGSAFRVVDGRYLVYVSVEGDLRAARYDPARHVVGRPVTLGERVRREAIGDGQFDLTRDGTLVYVPGLDAGIGLLVRLRAGGTPQPLPVEPASYQRFDLSPDGRRLAAVVQTADGQELRIHDFRTGQRATWLRAEYIRHPLWSADGERLLVTTRDSTRGALLIGRPSSGLAPDTVLSGVAGLSIPQPMDFASDRLVIGLDDRATSAIVLDLTAKPVRVDTLLHDVRFPSLAPGGRFLAWQTAEGSRILVASWPGLARKWQVAAGGVEPLWLSPTELLYRSGVSWYLARLDASTGEPMGAPVPWGRDPRFSDTQGWSNRPARDGGILYLQGPEQVRAGYVRLAPGWVQRMEAAVDAQGR